jgi:hypothetical protein
VRLPAGITIQYLSDILPANTVAGGGLLRIAEFTPAREPPARQAPRALDPSKPMMVQDFF